MSWSVSTQGTPDNVRDRINALEPSYEGTAAREDQIKAAKVTAIALLDSGCVGTGEAFSVSLSGHANDNHAPAPGWANCVMVSVVQITAAQVEQFDTQQTQAAAAGQ
jgi:uncharacterized protein YgbK (DUF1537 family)